jgi:hypothetical protein
MASVVTRSYSAAPRCSILLTVLISNAEMLTEKAQFFSAEDSVEASIVCDLEWYEPG